LSQVSSGFQQNTQLNEFPFHIFSFILRGMCAETGSNMLPNPSGIRLACTIPPTSEILETCDNFEITAFNAPDELFCGALTGSGWCNRETDG
jgi:hypothetical protein